jgi:hypothetical protein
LAKPCLNLTLRLREEQLLTLVDGDHDRKLRSILENAVAQYWAVKQPSFTDRLARILCARVT